MPTYDIISPILAYCVLEFAWTICLYRPALWPPTEYGIAARRGLCAMEHGYTVDLPHLALCFARFRGAK